MFVVSDEILLIMTSVQIESVVDDEAKPIADRMDLWYLDMKKNLLVKIFHRIFFFFVQFRNLFRNNSIKFGLNISTKLKKIFFKTKKS